MKAHDSYLTALLKLSDAVFNIPVYQRNYDWDIDNCKQLFQDIEMIAITEKNHFIGSIVYIAIGTATEPYYNIIDGQQRITSVMLFLKALHDSTDDKGFKQRIQIGFLTNLGLDGTPKMKLKQIESDRSVYEKIIMQDGFDEKSYSESEKNSNVYRNYSCFKEMIEQSDVALQDLYNAVFKLEIIDVCLTTEDPQEVFESMNSTGRTLTNTDLLRNYLLMDLPHNEQEKLYKKYWSQIEKNVGTNQMDAYMVHYLIMKRKSDSMNLRRKSAKINKNTLYDCYKIYFPPENKKDGGTERLLDDMCRYSYIYHKIFNSNGKSELDKAIHELISELNADPAAVLLMYLLYIQEKDNISDNDMILAVKACISYVFRVRIFKGSISPQFFALTIQYYENSDSALPFVDRIWSILVKGAGSYRFPRDREFRDAIENKNMYLEFKPPMLRYILYKYERARTKDLVEPTGATIEHILPQEPKEWQKHLMELNDNEYHEMIHRIGNLTLTKMNSEASNAPFTDKVVVYNKSGYAITREIAKMPDWSSKEIKDRSSSMAKEALLLWPLPTRYNQENSGEYAATNMSDETEELFNQARSIIRDFDQSIYEDPKKWYINYLRNKRILFSLIPQQDCLLATINAKIELFPNTNDLEDISQKGHWGVGNCRMKIEDENDIWTLLEYVQQISS